MLFLLGGPPQHSTWDPKPNAPAEVRGEFGPIATSAAGLSISELLPRTALLGDRLCVLRTMHTGDNAHSSSGYYMLTGVPHQPMNAENANPGAEQLAPVWRRRAALDFGRRGIARHRATCHSTFSIPMARCGRARTPAFWAAPTTLGCFAANPLPPTSRFPNSCCRPNCPWAACTTGEPCWPSWTAWPRAIFVRVPAPLCKGHAAGVRSLDLACRSERFQLADENDAVRDRYGRSQFGQSVLLARRLVEAGVRLVQVNWFRAPDEPPDVPCWDSHAREAAPAHRAGAAI